MSATESAGRPADSTLLVVGSAPCLFEDVARARGLYPDAEVMLINEAAGAIEDADHVLAGHTEKAEMFVAYRRQKFPNCRPFRVHAVVHSSTSPKDAPSVTDWWPQHVSTGASSAGKAARIGLEMGFTRIVLCGCPMNGGGYFNGDETNLFDHRCTRIGTQPDHRSSGNYRRRMQKLAESEFKGRVFSMSGFTKQVLGSPC
jgi:hypothetical protein